MTAKQAPARWALPIRTIHVGLGLLGCGIAALTARRPEFRPVGAVDPDPAKAGRDLGDLAGLGRSLGISVGPALAAGGADLAFHATGSHLPTVADQLFGLIDAGISVVSTCEELAYPWRRHPKLALRLDEAARTRGVSLLGTGVNPGFAMDALPLMLSGACQLVNRVRVVRILDSAKRRPALQLKAGAGLSIAEFDRRAAAGGLGHVGLAESAQMVASALGLTLDRIETELKPVVAESPVATATVAVEPGQALGQHQMLRGFAGERLVLEYELAMYLGAEHPIDRVEIDGVPPLTLEVQGGLPGDLATAAVIVNAGARLNAARPGLLTMVDMPLLHGRLGD